MHQAYNAIETAGIRGSEANTAVYFPSWDQARNTMYYSRAQKYPRLLARRQDLRFWPSTGE
ncbi:hypothetical protein T06_10533 [Trichinella sp. T6]|nr:hypothetical protein T06_10533 [Trichinella sp. T6]